MISTVIFPRLVLFTLLLMTSALPVSGRDTVFFPEGRPPEKPAIISLSGAPIRALVVVDGAKFYSSYAKRRRPLQEKPTYREVVTLYDRFESNWFLIKTQTGLFAWMQALDLLQTYICKRDRERGDFVKVILRNNLHSDPAPDQSLRVRNGPGLKYAALEADGLAEILFVFDERHTPGGRYLLLGTAPSWTYHFPQDSILGWVRADDCTFWNSRVAIYFNHRNLVERANFPARIFKTEEDLFSFERSGVATGVLATESVKSTSFLDFRTNRFPVVEIRGQHLKIGFIGGLTNTVRSGEQGLTDDGGSLRKIQILFVIDGASSMSSFSSEIAAGIQDGVETFQEPIQLLRQHVAVAVYRDQSDGPKAFEVVGDFDGQPTTNKLKPTTSVGESSPTHTMFNGVVQAVTAVHWTPGTVRELVLIGDHGDHPNYKSTTPAWVASKLLQYGVRFHVISIDVTPKTQKLSRLFQHQVKDIAAAKSEELDLRIVKNSEDLRAAVSGVLKQLLYEKGVNMGKFKLLKDRRPSEEGWMAASYKSNRQIEHWVYISRTELDELIGALAGIVHATNETDPAEVIKLTINRLSGDPLTEREDLGHFLKRRFGIPLREDSTVLQYSPEDLRTKLQDREFYFQFRHDVGFSYECLRLFAQEKKSPEDALEWDRTAGQWNLMKNDLEQEKTWVNTRSGATYAWVPLKYMP